MIYETLYADIYSQRTEVLINKMSKDQIKDLCNEFDNRVKYHEMDASFKQLDVPHFDVRDTIKHKKDGGIANFWQRAITNHPNISKHISEKDRVIL